jgi:TolB-like protein/cytochrome c-type biogenesis protein CcmH/NrfG
MVANPGSIRDHAAKMAGRLEMAEGSSDENASASMHAAFISYASQDTAVAHAIVEALERNGVRCWVAPRDVTPGTSYAGEIIHAIDAARVSVLILSKDAAASPHVLREVERSTSKRHPIVSLRIDQAPLPADFEYFLNTSHWLDASAVEIGRALPKLVAAVQLALKPPATTPTGIPTSHFPASAVSVRSPNRAPLLVASVIGLGLLGFAADRLWFSSRRVAATPALAQTTATPAPETAPRTIPEKSVAVLPFVDMSEKKDQEYFSDGMSEELIDMLTRIPDLRVPARTSSFYFKGKQTTIADVAKALRVLYVLEGSVRKSGGAIRVTAQLIRADNGYHIWSETYDRKLDDVFKVQDEIAGSVVRALKVSLSAGTTQRPPPTSNLAAYSLYLESMLLTRRGSKEDLESAVANVRKAVQLDPAFAAGWAELSRALSTQGLLGYVPFAELRDDAWHAAMQASKLDPDLGSAYIAIGKLRRFCDADYTGADAAFKRAIQLDPRDPDALRWASLQAASLGRFEEALNLAEQAITQDPLYDQNFAVAASIYAALGQLDKAEAAARIASKLNPRASNSRLGLAFVLLVRGKLDDALAESRLAEDPEGRLSMEAIVYHALGRAADADAALAEFKAKFGHDNPFALAEIYARRGDRTQALAELERAAASNDASADFADIKTDLNFNIFASDPRYKALLRRMKLPE